MWRLVYESILKVNIMNFFANVKSRYQDIYSLQIWAQSEHRKKTQDRNKVASHRVHSKTSVSMETVLKLERKFFHDLNGLDRGSKSGDLRIILHILKKT